MSSFGAAARLAGFGAFTLPLMPVQWALVKAGSGWMRRFPHWYHRQVLKFLGVTLRIEGEPPRGGPCLIASNHVSWLDIPVLSAAAPLSFIAKREVAGWPFFGSLARLQRTVFVDRRRNRTTASSRDELSERLAEGDIVVLFAEGTSSDGSRVLPFKSAFFAAAETPGLRIQPVSVVYRRLWGLPMTRRHRPLCAWYGDMDLPPHLWSFAKIGPVGVTVIFHPPLTVGEMGSRKSAAKAAEDAVRRGLVEALTGRMGGVGRPPQ